jgi:hypothetical protein
LRKHLPVALSAAALVVAVLGATPAGHAAGPLGRIVDFARNAGKVNGIEASRTPRAGKLVPLDANAKLPARVLPEAARGAEGPAGPRGPAGPSEAYFSVGRSLPVRMDGTLVRSFDVRQAGSYVVVAKVALATVAGFPGEVVCNLAPRGGTPFESGSVRADDPYARPWSGTLTLATIRSTAAAEVLELRCATTTPGEVTATANTFAIHVESAVDTTNG